MRIDVDWRSSRLSALSLMRRTAFTTAALALLATAGLLSAQTSQATKTQRKPAMARNAHGAYRPAETRSTGRVAAHARTYSSSRTNLSATRTRRTPDEVGREAGLAILRQRAGTQDRRFTGAPATRRLPAYMERRRSTRRMRLERAAWRPKGAGATRAEERSEAATDYADSEPGQTGTGYSQGAEAGRVDGARETMPDTSLTEANEPEEGVGVGTAPVERMTRDEAAEDTKNDEASLVIPRSGMPAPLRGSLESLERQNDRLEAEGLERIEDDSEE